MKSGCWDSLHIIEVTENSTKTNATYKLTATVMLTMNVDKQEVGATAWSGVLTRQVRENNLRYSSLDLFNLIPSFFFKDGDPCTS